MLIIVIVVITIAILAVLGFLFWQNFIKSGTVASITTFEQCKAAPNSKILLTYPEQCVTFDGQTFTGPTKSGDEFKTYCTVAEKLCFEYLSDWKVEVFDAVNPDPGASADNIHITSPDGKLALHFNSAISGLGGTCSEESGQPVTIVEATPIPGLMGYKDDYNQDQAVVTRTVYKDTDQYVAALYVTTDPRYAVKGVINACDTGFSQFVDGRHSVISSDFEGAGAFRFGYTGSEYFEENSIAQYDTIEEATEAYVSDNYVKATALMTSLRYE